uniref:Immunoglobulin V-set domain-containing protein n=1 Tax=Sparus aurata TaxID=8175 RepID=A0A671U150_SPAAU
IAMIISSGIDNIQENHQSFCSTSQGDTVTLGCTFETSDTFPYLFWYKQEVNDFPKYILKCSSLTVEHAADFEKDRYTATIINKSVPLKIQKLQRSDSAVYYFASFFYKEISIFKRSGIN